MSRIILSFIFCVTFVIVSACKDESSKNSRNTDSVVTEQLSESNNIIIETKSRRVLRNAPQFLASAAKLLSLNPSELAEASEYESIKSKLPSETKITRVNPSDAAFIAASKIATAGCNLYIKEEESNGLGEFVQKLAKKASFDLVVRSSLSNGALNVLVGTELESQDNVAEIKNSKIITCSYIVVTKILF